METTGWLFDLYPLNDRMVLWFIARAGDGCGWWISFSIVFIWGGRGAGSGSGPGLGKGGLGAAGLSNPGPGIVERREIPVLALELKLMPTCPGSGGGWGARKRAWPPTTATWTRRPTTFIAAGSGPAPGTTWRPGTGGCATSPPGRSVRPGAVPAAPGHHDPGPHPGPPHPPGQGQRLGRGLGRLPPGIGGRGRGGPGAGTGPGA